MNRILLPALLPLGLCLGPTALAQAVQSVPANADLADGHQSSPLPFGVPGFRTQILVDVTAVAQNGGAILGLRLRGDRNSAPMAAGTVPNVTLRVSQTTLAIGALGTTFAGNVTGSPIQVFQGTVTLPAQTPGLAGPMPWNVVIPFTTPFPFNSAQGNLLLDITGANPTGGTPNYFLDAVEGGGAATTFGVAGDNPSFDNLELIASTGNDLIPRLISPGNFVEYNTTLTFTHPPGVLVLGLAALPSPFDLGPLGAPTHTIYVDPLALVTQNWTQSFIGWFSTVRVGIPNQPAFLDARIYAQPVLFEPTANALGMLAGYAMETLVGDGQQPLPLQQLDALDPQAATGTILDFGAPQVSRLGAVAIRLEGVFQ